MWNSDRCVGAQIRQRHDARWCVDLRWPCMPSATAHVHPSPLVRIYSYCLLTHHLSRSRYFLFSISLSPPLWQAIVMRKRYVHCWHLFPPPLRATNVSSYRFYRFPLISTCAYSCASSLRRTPCGLWVSLFALFVLPFCFLHCFSVSAFYAPFSPFSFVFIAHLCLCVCHRCQRGTFTSMLCL